MDAGQHMVRHDEFELEVDAPLDAGQTLVLSWMGRMWLGLRAIFTYVALAAMAFVWVSAPTSCPTQSAIQSSGIGFTLSQLFIVLASDMATLVLLYRHGSYKGLDEYVLSHGKRETLILTLSPLFVLRSSHEANGSGTGISPAARRFTYLHGFFHASFNNTVQLLLLFIRWASCSSSTSGAVHTMLLAAVYLFAADIVVSCCVVPLCVIGPVQQPRPVASLAGVNLHDLMDKYAHTRILTRIAPSTTPNRASSATAASSMKVNKACTWACLSPVTRQRRCRRSTGTMLT